MIEINNFVNVNIERNVQLTLSGSREEVLLFSAKTSATLVGHNSDYTKFYSSSSSNTEVELDDADKPYAKYFFMNGGCKLTLKKDAIPTDEDGFKALSTNNVILASEATISNATFTALDSLKGVYQKIIVVRTEDPSNDSTPESSFIASKYSMKVGSEMAIAGYLSQIKFYQNNSPVDYDFTLETLPTGSEEDLSDKVILDEDSLIKYKYNFNMKIGDNYYNIGGNTTDGNDLVEQFGLIVMEQELTTSIFKTLSTKVSGQKGLASIRTSVADTLNNFVDSGFLITNQVWTQNDLVLENKVKKGNYEVVIAKNTPISNGYYIHIFKISTDLRKAYVAIVVATNKGIRYVEVDGKAI